MEPEVSLLCLQELVHSSWLLAFAWGRRFNRTPSYYLKTHCNFLPIPRSSKCSLSFRVSHQSPVLISFLTHACYMPHQSHPSCVNDCNNTRSGIQIMKLSLHNFLQHHVTSSRTAKSTIKLWFYGSGSGSWLRMWSYKEPFLLFKRKTVILVLYWHRAKCKQFTSDTMQCNQVMQNWSNLKDTDIIFLM
jgi:hypothetical protein